MRIHRLGFPGVHTGLRLAIYDVAAAVGCDPGTMAHDHLLCRRQYLHSSYVRVLLCFRVGILLSPRIVFLPDDILLAKHHRHACLLRSRPGPTGGPITGN